MIDSDMLEWLSFTELESLHSENLISELETKLLLTEKENIQQLMMKEEKTNLLISQIDEADGRLEELQNMLEQYLAKVQEVRQKTKSLEDKNILLAIKQENTSALIQTIQKKLNS